MEQLKLASTLAHGLIGVALVGGLALALLSIIIAGAPAQRYLLTSYDAPLSSSSE